MRTPFIAGNWKMHMTIEQSLELVKGIHYGLKFPGEVDVVVAPPFTALERVANFLQDSYIGVSAQNMHWQDKGAYTGEIPAGFIKDVGCDYVIIGHSERRQYFDETDETVNLKTKNAFKHGLIPIVCVGETLEERESGNFAAVIENQIKNGLAGLSSSEANVIVVAYEPVWAIGTGKTASPQQAEDVHHLIRSLLERMFGGMVADSIRILYGGSVKPSNSKELLSLPNIDGALIGGAALKADDFIAVIKSANS